jgi:inosose dehydratase
MRLSYALNQWKQGHDQFVVRADHEKAFKTLVVAGFDRIEIPAGTGRWEPLGNREWIEKSYGSVAALRELMTQCGIGSVSSYTFNPELPILEEGSRGRNVLDADDHPAIASTATRLAELCGELGGDLLVVRPLASAWRLKDLDGAALNTAAQCWNTAGQAIAPHGVRLALNIDCLGALRTGDDIEALLDACDPETVGLSIDTADAVIMGLDPLALYERFKDRVWHFHLKDTKAVDTLAEATAPSAERTFLIEGGAREIERWYFEMMTPGGLVDFPALAKALQDYAGLLVVESDQSPYPVTSALLNGWARQRLFGAQPASETR